MNYFALKKPKRLTGRLKTNWTYLPIYLTYFHPGDGVAQLVEVGLKIQRPEVRTPSGAQGIFIFIFTESKKLCRLAVDVPMQAPCVYALISMMTYAR